MSIALHIIVDRRSPVEPGEHKHLCASCGTCWKHSDEMANNPDIFWPAHSCPSCGQVQRLKHWEPGDVQLLTEKEISDALSIVNYIQLICRNRKANREFARQYHGSDYL